VKNFDEYRESDFNESTESENETIINAIKRKKNE